MMPVDTPAGAVTQFSEQGFVEYQALQNHPGARRLYDAIYASRPFDTGLFLSEEEWEKSDKSHRQTNPRDGRNVLEGHAAELAFVEQDAALNRLLAALLGTGFRWAFRKVVCRLAHDTLPGWLSRLIGKTPANTLNAFIRPEYRDISYYLENDLHQDIQDYPRLPPEKREHRVLSLYMHLSDVAIQDAPLYLMPGTHRFGATSYQHDIRKTATDSWQYRDDAGRAMATGLHPVLGPAGHIALWHSCLIHGARPVKTARPRLVLRYMLAQSPHEDCGLARVNAQIQGPLFPDRDDSAGAHARPDGAWNLKETDFTQLVP